MINLVIDDKKIKVRKGTLLIDAARENGIDIPSLCYMKGIRHYSSCMICMVKDNKENKFIPSCSAVAEEGMNINASGEQVIALRKEAISLLLTEHRAECEAPCSLVCPMGLDIPLMNRLIAGGDIRSASLMIHRDLILPETTCAVCPGYCENACRRKMIDKNIAIREIIKYTSTIVEPEKPIIKTDAREIAVIGTGPAGTIVATILENKGHKVTLLDAYKEIIPRVELAVITGPWQPSPGEIKIADRFLVDEGDIATMDSKYIFFAGDMENKEKHVIRTLGKAKKKAIAIARFLETGEIRKPRKRFNSTIGKIQDAEKKEWLKECKEGTHRWDKPGNEEEIMEEAVSCMHCDCRAKDHCTLRELAEKMEISNPRLKQSGHSFEKKINNNNYLIFENTKCIKCGLCVRLSIDQTDSPSLCFTGRGFMSLISEPLTNNFNDVFMNGIEDVIKACPTGALEKKE